MEPTGLLELAQKSKCRQQDGRVPGSGPGVTSVGKTQVPSSRFYLRSRCSVPSWVIPCSTGEPWLLSPMHLLYTTAHKTFASVCVCVCVCVYIYIYIYIYIYVYMCIYIYIYVYIQHLNVILHSNWIFVSLEKLMHWTHRAGWQSAKCGLAPSVLESLPPPIGSLTLLPVSGRE